jgi:hypothetical protein
MVFRSAHRRFTVLATAAAFGAASLAAPVSARADNVSPSGKGIAGGALLGAEVVTIVEALIGVRSGWAYVVGAVVGAGGGGAGGYAIEHSSTDGKVPTYMLAGGLALVIPAIVLTLNATRYLPEEGATEDRVPIGPAAEPGVPGGSIGAPGAPAPAIPPSSGAPAPAIPPSSGAPAPATPPTTTTTPPPPPHSLLDVIPGTFRLGLPIPDVVPIFTVAEQRQYGMKNDTELRMPVLHVTF